MTNLKQQLENTRTSIEPAPDHRDVLRRKIVRAIPRSAPMSALHPEYAIMATGVAAAIICWSISIVLSQTPDLPMHHHHDPILAELYQFPETSQPSQKSIGLVTYLKTFIPDSEMGQAIPIPPARPHPDFMSQ